MGTPTANQIAQFETRHLNESKSAIMVALNMDDRDTSDAFVKEVLHKTLLQCMSSPPHTDLLCITLMGNVTAQEFAALWQKHLGDEPAMVHFLERMQAADVIHGTPQGKMLGQVSLLESGRTSPGSTSGSGLLARLKSVFKGGRA